MLNIFLGSACNFNCAYCLQGKESPNRVKTPDYDKFVETFSQYASGGISYWGGEPLLYWKDIQAIQNRFDAAGVKSPLIKIMTNGSLITDECVSDVNKWRASLRLSYHDDLSSIKFDKLKNVDDFGVSYVLHGQRFNIYDTFKWNNDIQHLMKKHVHLYGHWVRSTKETPKEFWFTKEHLPSLHLNLLNVAKDALNGEPSSINFFIPHYIKWKKSLAITDYRTDGLCHGADKLNVTLDGNRYTCHHNCTDVNKVENVITFQKLAKPNEFLADTNSRKFVDSTECKSCKLRSLCQGNCHLSQTHTIDCKLEKIKANVYEYLDLQDFNEQLTQNGFLNGTFYY
jgi:radical SAM protein with 4Fe4S-binding SPASM domain